MKVEFSEKWFSRVNSMPGARMWAPLAPKPHEAGAWLLTNRNRVFRKIVLKGNSMGGLRIRDPIFTSTVSRFFFFLNLTKGGKSKSGLVFQFFLVLFSERNTYIAENITSKDGKISLCCLSVCKRQSETRTLSIIQNTPMPNRVRSVSTTSL